MMRRISAVLSSTSGLLKVAPNPSKGELLWSGNLSWSTDELAVKSINVPVLGTGSEDQFLLSVRNASADVALKVFVGMSTECYPTIDSPRDSQAVYYTEADIDSFSSENNALIVGDAVVFSGDGGNVVPGVIYYVTSVDGERFQVSLRRGGTVIDVDVDEETNTVSIVDEFFELTSFDVPAFAIDTTTTPVAGLVSKLVSGFGHYGGRLMVAKAAETAAAFNCYMEIRRA